MPSENETNVNDDPVPNDDGINTTSQEPTYTKDETTRLIKREVAKVLEKYADYDEKSQRLAELETAQLSELEKLQKQLDDERKAREQAEQAAQAETLERLRLQVATEKGLPALFAGRLKGTTQEELEADADALSELVKSEPPPRRTASTDASAGTRQTSQSDGLTDAEREQARRFGLTDEQMLQAKQHKPKGFMENG